MSRDLHIIGFQVGSETYGVPIASLHEIVRVPEITPIPGRALAIWKGSSICAARSSP